MQTSVLVLYNQPEDNSNLSEAGILVEVQAVADALSQLSIPYRAIGVRDLKETADILAQSPEPVVFNLVEGFAGSLTDVNFVPTLCRAMGKAFTGNDTSALSLALDKWQSKLVLQSAYLPTPRGSLVPVGHKIKKQAIGTGPYIVKPVATDASEGIDSHSIVKSSGAKLAGLVAQVHDQFSQPAIIEEYLDGREFNVSVIQSGNEIRVLPIAEIDFSAFDKSKPKIVGYAAKWHAESFEFNNTPRVIPAAIPTKLAGQIRSLALDAWNAVGCQDYASVDFRLDSQNRPYVLEINPNPDISPDAGFAAALTAAGIEYKDFVRMMIANALDRFGPRQMPPAKTKKVKKPLIRPSTASDRQAVLQFLTDTGFFRPDEIEIAAEVLDEANAKGTSGHYKSYVLEQQGRAAGWICWGQTACSVGTYDIYWIGVDPKCQCKGIGSILMNFAHENIKSIGGRIAIIETSGKALYQPTRKFYLKLGYKQAARVVDFYAKDDDKIIYTKIL